MEEIWKEVYHNGVYVGKKVSNTGRLVRDDGTECLLSDNGAGYLSFQKTQVKQPDGKWKAVRVYAHRLVAEYFLPNPDNLPQVNHKDCDKSNNHSSNLEWSSRRDNILHAHKEGRMVKRTKDNTATVWLTVDEVIECYTRVKQGEGLSAVARSMSKPRTTISSIMNKRSRSDITDRIDVEIIRARIAVREMIEKIKGEMLAEVACAA